MAQLIDGTTRPTRTASTDDIDSLVASYAADQFAAVQHALKAVAQHVDSEEVQALPELRSVLSRLHTTLEAQARGIEMHLEREFGGKGFEGALKDAVTNISGFLAGIYGKMRGETASRMVRDDITAVNFLATCYSMLYATAISFNQQKTATLASTHLHQLTPFVIELSRVVPSVVVEEFVRQGYAINEAAIGEAIEDVADAWSTTPVV